MQQWHINLVVALCIVSVYTYLTAGEHKEHPMVTDGDVLKIISVSLAVYLSMALSPQGPHFSAVAVLGAYFIFNATITR